MAWCPVATWLATTEMSQSQPSNPLHGITLEQMLMELVDSLGWEKMGRAVAIRCFTHNPSVDSSLHFLRRTPWAKAKVEELYLRQVKRTTSRGK
jgi:uncharacterized protein (DUF2132 family)